MAIVLLITTENGQTLELPILTKCTVGRSSSCDLTIDDRQMSGKHGSFEINHRGELIYTDLGSTNGSFLNNSKVEKVQLKLNETLRLGKASFIIDPKRLTNGERISLGKGVGDEATLVIPSATQTKSQHIESIEPKEKEEGAKRSVVLGKGIKKTATWAGKNESQLEQDPSTGKTRMLKLDINKNKKK